MRDQRLVKFEQKIFKNVKKAPEFKSGDTIRVHYKIQEGADAEKFRVQVYEGVVLRYRKGTASSSFTVRKIGAGGVGVERCFPMYSPFVDKIEVVAHGMVNRARLYYLRNLTGKSARIKSRFLGKVGVSTPAEQTVAAVQA